MKLRHFVPVTMVVALVLGLGLFQTPTAVAAGPIGHFDGLTTNDTFEGWALRTDYSPHIPESQLTVHLYMNGPAGKGVLAASSNANLPRPDVNQAIGYAGNHGFRISVPDLYKDGVNHSVYIYAIGGDGLNTLLPGSGRIYNFGHSSTNNSGRHSVGSLVIHQGTVYYMDLFTRNPIPSLQVFQSYGYSFSNVFVANSTDLMVSEGPVVKMKQQNTATNKNPIGSIDGVNTVSSTIKGWALDPDNSSATLEIEVTFDGPMGSKTVSASTWRSANISRPDVNSVTGYSGNHGYLIDIPDSLKDGFTHAAYIYAVDANTKTKIQLVQSPINFRIENASLFTVDFYSDNTSIAPGQATTLHWIVNPSSASTNITTIGHVDNLGAKMISPSSTTAYTLNATHNGKTINRTITVSVNQGSPAIYHFTSNRSLVSKFDNQVTLSWAVENATSVMIEGKHPNAATQLYNVDASGSLTFNLNMSTAYTLTATNAVGGAQKSLDITFQ